MSTFVPGEVEVEIQKPYARFGLAVYIYIRSGQTYHVARVDEKGELLFKEVDNHTMTDPTFFMDERVASKMHAALAGQPSRLLGDQAHDHLQDTKAVRDRMMSWIEKLITNPAGEERIELTGKKHRP